jgi:hydroxylaminobenzene mutase
MDDVSRRICFSGLAMFVFGLAIGFCLKAFPNPRVALSAHLNGVQSGTFLIALALIWPKLAIWKSLAGPLGHVVWIAFWVLEVGMVIAAFAAPSEAGAGPAPVRVAAAVFQGAGGIAMFVALAALLFTFGPAGVAKTATPAERTSVSSR